MSGIGSYLMPHEVGRPAPLSVSVVSNGFIVSDYSATNVFDNLQDTMRHIERRLLDKREALEKAEEAAKTAAAVDPGEAIADQMLSGASAMSGIPKEEIQARITRALGLPPAQKKTKGRTIRSNRE